MPTPEVNKPYSSRQFPLAFVLAGGAGTRMYPLTRDRAKPSVPFGANYRIIDFALSNIYHSGIRKICILTQYESVSLHRHIRNGWYPRFGIGVDEFITTLPAKQGGESGWYLGTADSIHKNLRHVKNEKPNIVDILGGDHIYLMDIDEKNNYHLKHEADITISAIPVKIEDAANNYGVLVVDENMHLIDFQEKPANPTPMPGDVKYCLASMGNYAFDAQVLMDDLYTDSKKTYSSDKTLISNKPAEYSSHDFGYDIIPNALKNGRKILVYNFKDHGIPGADDHDKGFWRDVGNIDQFYLANMEMIQKNPALNLYNNDWKILTYIESPQPAKIMSSEANSGYAANSLLANGVIINDAVVKNSIIHYGSRIRKKADIRNSILLGRIDVGNNVKIKNTIIDRFVTIPNGEEIGYDREKDLARGFTISDSGITVIPRKFKFSS